MSRLPKVANSHRRLYPSDLSDSEWEAIRPLLRAPKGFGRPRTVDIREILNAVFYVQRSRCQWEMLPHDFPHHGTVYKYFQKWERLGFWKKKHDTLRHQLREKLGRKEKSTVAIADSISVETTEKSGATPLGFPQHGNAHQDRGKSRVTMVARNSIAFSR